MRIAITFAIIFLIVSVSFANGLEQGIRIKCLSVESDAWFQFEVTSYNLVDGKPTGEVINADHGEKAYFDNDKHIAECNIDKHIIKVEFQNRLPRDRGQCGAAPGADLTAWIDGRILYNGLFNNSCYDSLEKMKFIKSKWESEGLTFEICGHTGGGSNPRVEGCFEFKRVLIEAIKLPLPPFFSEMISIKLFNKDKVPPKSNK